MEFRVLGPFEAFDRETQVPLGAAKQRAVLAMLLLHANTVVPRDRLIDGVWGDGPPETAATALQGYVSGLRKAVGRERLRTVQPGYVLDVEPAALDVRRFEALAAEGRADLALGNAETAAARLTDALALWRGEPFADLDPALGFVAAERRRLNETRLGVVEDRLDARLALGHDGELVPELVALVGEEPLRERPRAQLMRALYRSGRHSDALDVYRGYRSMLARDLGLEPSGELQELQRAILGQDPNLGATPRRPPGGRPRTRRRTALALLGLVVLVMLAVAAAAWLSRESKAVAVPADSIAIVDPSTRRIVETVRLDEAPVDVAYGFGSAWVAGERGTVTRIGPHGEVVARLDVGTAARDIGTGFGSVWVAGGADGTVTSIDPALNVREAVLRVGSRGSPVLGIASGRGAVWAIAGATLVRIDPGNTAVASRNHVPRASGIAAAPFFGTVWLVDQRQRLLEFVPGTDSVVGTMTLDGPGAAPVVSAGAVWLIVYGTQSQVWRVDRLGVPPQILVAASRSPLLGLALDRRSIWTIEATGTLVRRDRLSGQVDRRIATAPTVRSALAVGSGRVWVAIQRPS